jgi:hypothetical protein
VGQGCTLGAGCAAGQGRGLQTTRSVSPGDTLLVSAPLCLTRRSQQEIEETEQDLSSAPYLLTDEDAEELLQQLERAPSKAALDAQEVCMGAASRGCCGPASDKDTTCCYRVMVQVVWHRGCALPGSGSGMGMAAGHLVARCWIKRRTYQNAASSAQAHENLVFYLTAVAVVSSYFTTHPEHTARLVPDSHVQHLCGGHASNMVVPAGPQVVPPLLLCYAAHACRHGYNT